MKNLLIFTVLLPLFNCCVIADTLSKVKLANSTEVEIHPLHYNSQTKTVSYATVDKKIAVAPLRSFHETERPRLSSLTVNQKQQRLWTGSPQDEPEQFPPVPPKGWQLVGWSDSDRKHIQSFDVFDYETKHYSRPNSLINTLRWWDQQQFVKFPQKRSAEKQDKWLHNNITKATESEKRNSDQWSRVSAGMVAFSKKHLNSNYLFPCFKVNSLTPNRLVHYTQGNTAACLSISVYHGKRYQFKKGVTLLSAESDGRLKIHTRGLKLSGKLVTLGKQTISRRHDYTKPEQEAQSYEIELFNKTDLPDRFERDKIRFLIEPKRENFLYVFLPYERQTVGKTWIPHPATTGFSEEIIPEVKKEVVLHRTSPVTDFSLPPGPITRKWLSSDGKPLNATLLSVDGNSTATFKKGHKQVKVSLEKLSAEDQARTEFWQSSKGTKYTLPAATLCYSARTRSHSSVPPKKVLIHYDGSNKAVMMLPFFNREYRYDSSAGRLEVYDLKSGEPIKQINCVHHKTLNGIPKLNLNKFEDWSPASVRDYACRSTKVPYFTSGKTYYSNVVANPIVELLGYTNGWRNENILNRHGSLKNELAKSLELARHWDLLPTRLHWTSKIESEKGSLELVSVALGTDADFTMKHSKAE